MEPEISLDDAIDALRNKDKPRAREILDAVIRQDPQNDMAWLYMALAAENRKQALACLERATQINPANNKAWELIEKLESSQPHRKSTARKGKSNSLKFALIGVGSLLVIVVLFVAGLLISGYFDREASVAAIPPFTTVSEADISPQADTTPIARTPTRDVPPTWTPTPSSSPTSDTPKNLNTPVASTLAIQGNPQDFCLTLTDLPDGYKTDATNTGPSTNEQVAVMRDDPEKFLALVEKWGRIGGYATAYNNYDLDSSIFNVASWVVVMKTPSGAHDYFQYLKNEDKQAGGLSVSVPLIGDESYGRLSVNDFLGRPMFDVNFRKQNVLVTVSVLGGQQDLSEEAIKYARLLEARLSGEDSPQVSSPTPTPKPAFAEITRSLGPIRSSSRDEAFSVEITIHDVEWSTGSDYIKARQGYIYSLVHLTIKNLGPGPMRNVSSSDFQVLDANGALRGTSFGVNNCDFDFVDLLSGGKILGCIGFEVPDSGKLEFIYAPYQYGNLEEGRYIRVVLRP